MVVQQQLQYRGDYESTTPQNVPRVVGPRCTELVLNVTKRVILAATTAHSKMRSDHWGPEQEIRGKKGNLFKLHQK